MKLIILIISIVGLVYGWILGSLTLSIFSAVVFIVGHILELARTIRSARRFRSGEEDSELELQNEHTLKKVESIFDAIICLVGLGAFAYGVKFSKDNSELWSYPGMIIWIGSIISYFAQGVVIREITGIPLKWGYGGWYINRRKQTNRKSKRY
jgi:hypothetical protein